LCACRDSYTKLGSISEIELRRDFSVQNRCSGFIVVLMAVVVLSSVTFAQRSPQLGEAKAHAAVPAGSHDLAGVWLMDTDAYHNDPGAGSLKPAPMTSWGEEKFKANAGKPGYDDPTFHCDPPGLPRIALGQAPFEIIQIPGRVLILYEEFYEHRQIWMDGRALPKDPDPTWYGYSVGKWEGDALVVETIGFDDRSWLDGNGHSHSDAMHVVERYRRLDHDTLELTMTIDDPRAYTRPWVSKSPKTFKLAPKTGPKAEVMELLCVPEDEEAFRKAVREPAVSKPSH
jgi:hypothetical protein